MGSAALVLIIIVVLFATQCGGPAASVEVAASTTTTTAAQASTTAPSTTSSAPTTTVDAEKVKQDEAAAIAQGQCPDSAIGITVSAEKPNYAVGQQPRFFTTITNIGNVPCARDLSDSLTPNVVTTLDGQNRLWSSTDCFPGGPARIVTLAPGKQERTQIDWSGTTSSEGCAAPREAVGPGAYMVTAFNGGKASAPETFNIG